jgi:hypothetical protein
MKGEPKMKNPVILLNCLSSVGNQLFVWLRGKS